MITTNVFSSYRYSNVVRRITGVQFALESQNGVGYILVAQQQRVVFGRIDTWFAASAVLLIVPIL